MTGPRAAAPESAIDILYENQRGGFLCGMPLFSSRALGNLDPPAWTNFAHKSSPTNIHTAQVPDPSWDWAWPDWRINHQEGMDEDGWEYSFMFAKHFSWHGPRWWNSFVRRRAWIRKRVKKAPGPESQDPHMLGPEYFSVRAPLDRGRDRSRSPSMDTSHRTSKLSVSTDQKVDTDGGEGIRIEDIRDIAELLRVLRASRIDREKIEAVESYLENGEDDLAHLQEEMHEIMSLFVFQASRRVLLSRLAQLHDQAKKALHDDEPSPRMERRAENLAAAVKHADEEVRKLEYWSDVKGMAKEGESEGAVDQRRGWDSTWQGVDRSGPSEPSPKRYP
ncbi:hypothetical protein GQ53DRAFT_520 [Thozetella sp. PMI_491]|nr:hypothetical protein GQ53DRAFT_520 [Thozetella sp. PMI_491]